MTIMNKLLIITWVSTSGKTSLQSLLLENWWNKPINFTTRQPRSDAELDEYVFLDKQKFLIKYSNWDFLENTNYWDNFYWISKYFPNWNICIILDPVWRAQIEQKIANWELSNYKTSFVFLECSPEEQLKRLKERWSNEEEINKRKKDFTYFNPTRNSIVLKEKTILENYKKLCEVLKMT